MPGFTQRQAKPDLPCRRDRSANGNHHQDRHTCCRKRSRKAAGARTMPSLPMQSGLQPPAQARLAQLPGLEARLAKSLKRLPSCQPPTTMES